MARHQVVSITVKCDVCGEEVSEEAQGAPRKINWEGADYVLDICARDRAELDEVLGRLKTFVRAGSEQAPTARRRVGAGPSAAKAEAKSAPRSGPRPAPGRADIPAIRAWASDHGHQVGHRGRIPASVIAAYDQAQSAPEASPAPKKRRPRKAASSAA